MTSHQDTDPRPSRARRGPTPSRRTSRALGAAICLSLASVLAAPAAQATVPTTTTAVRTVTPVDLGTYVTAVYRDLFGRAPDAQGLATWTSSLASGTPRGDVARAITSSNEYRTTLIAGAYREYLGRVPDAQGLAFWLGNLSAGRTIQELEDGFVASDEYYALAGSSSTTWITRLYSGVLGRTPASSEVAHWQARLDGGSSRADVAMGFLLSSERLRAVVDASYRKLLNRSIDANGAASWVAAIQQGTRLEAVIGGIVASDEYASAHGGVGPVAAAPTPVVVPSTGAFPNASNTGVPAGVALTPYTGPSTITQAGTVIDGKLITTPLVIAASASNVTIKNSRMAAQGYWLVLNDAGAKNLQILDSEMDGLDNTSGDSAIAGYNYTLTRVNIHSTVDGLKLGSNVTVQDSYIHDLVLTADSHNDGMQSLGSENVVIRHNTVIVADGSTSAILLSTGSADSMRNILIDNNLLGGGAFTVYGGYQSGVDTLSKVSGVVISNNRITTSVFPRGGAYGPLTSVSSPAVTLSNNVWNDGAKAGTAL